MGVMVLRSPVKPRALQRMDKVGTFNPNSTNITLVPNFTSANAASTVSASHELIVKGTGLYSVIGSAAFPAVAVHQVYVWRNGAALILGTASASAAGTFTATSSSVLLNDGDLLTLRIRSGTTARSNINASGTFLQITPI